MEQSHDKHISEVLDTFLKAKTLSATEAATEVTDLCDLKDPEGFCWALWAGIIARASDGTTDTDQHDRLDNIEDLVDLTAAIKAQPALLNPDTGEDVTFWAGTCWKDLPLLSAQMRETWNDIDRHTIYLTIFAARLTAREVMSFSLYAIWAFRAALEGDTPWCHPGPRSVTIPAACAWVEHAGADLIKLDDDYGRAGQGGTLWTGKSGYCKERWQLWRNGLRLAAEDASLSQDTREGAGQAAGRIAELLLVH